MTQRIRTIFVSVLLVAVSAFLIMLVGSALISDGRCGPHIITKTYDSSGQETDAKKSPYGCFNE